MIRRQKHSRKGAELREEEAEAGVGASKAEDPDKLENDSKLLTVTLSRRGCLGQCSDSCKV